MKKSSDMLKTAGKVLRYLAHYRVLFILSLIFAVVVVVTTLYLPVLTGEAIDLIVDRGAVDFAALIPLLQKAAAVIAITALAQWIMNICNNAITFGVVRRLRFDAFKRIQSLPLAYLDRRPVGDTVSRVIADADQFTDGLLMGFSQFFTGVLTILGTLVFMLTINLPMTLWVVAVTPLSLFVASRIAKSTHSMFRKQAEIRAEETALVDEMLTSHKTVVAFSHEEETLRDFDEINGRLETVSRRAVFFSSTTNPSTRAVNNLVYAGVALIGALIALGQPCGMTLSVGALSTFLSYANQYTKPFNEISGVITELQNAMTCAARLFELIEAEPEVPEDADAVVLARADGRVELEDVAFSYTPERELIRDFNLSLEKGQRVAIVGPTGCGKTTVINLLMRFYDVKEGSIRVGGAASSADAIASAETACTDIRRMTRHSLRENYGMVLQETWLSTDTVRANIAYGRPDATDDEIVAAAKAAHADSFIRRLPKGYDTVIGEDGGRLSQGQKQLLCIARVFLCLPPMLILDEATSSIDTRTELKIQNAFATLMKGRTSFIVAHRLSTVKEADIILVMKDGRIIEQGDHRTLLARGGFYADLYNSQFES